MPDLTAIPDLTAGGALSVQVHIEDNTNTTLVTPAQIPQHSNLTAGSSPLAAENSAAASWRSVDNPSPGPLTQDVPPTVTRGPMLTEVMSRCTGLHDSRYTRG